MRRATVVSLITRSFPLACCSHDTALDNLLAQLRQGSLPSPSPSVEMSTLKSSDPSESVRSLGRAHKSIPGPILSGERLQRDDAVNSVHRVRNPFHNSSFPKREAVDWTLVLRSPFFAMLTAELKRSFDRCGEVTTDNLYSQATLDECLLPLLRSCDYALEVEDIEQFLPFFDKDLLRKSLEALDEKHEASQIFVKKLPHRSTVVCLDASREGFLLRYLPSIHASWEPLEVISRRQGLFGSVLPRDALVSYLDLMTSRTKLIEMGVLFADAQGRPISRSFVECNLTAAEAASKREYTIILRRSGSVLSLTETNRMIGIPAVAPPRKKASCESNELCRLFESLTSHMESSGASLGETLQKITTNVDQAKLTRLGAFSVPQRYFQQEPDPPAAADSKRKHSGTVAVVVPQRPAEQRPGRAVHHLKVRIVFLKQQLRIAQGIEAETIKNQLERTRALLAEALGSIGGSTAPLSATVPEKMRNEPRITPGAIKAAPPDVAVSKPPGTNSKRAAHGAMGKGRKEKRKS